VLGSAFCSECDASIPANALKTASVCSATCPPGKGVHYEASSLSDSKSACGLCHKYGIITAVTSCIILLQQYLKAAHCSL
jgi:hypothetical protein